MDRISPEEVTQPSSSVRWGWACLTTRRLPVVGLRKGVDTSRKKKQQKRNNHKVIPLGREGEAKHEL